MPLGNETADSGRQCHCGVVQDWVRRVVRAGTVLRSVVGQAARHGVAYASWQRLQRHALHVKFRKAGSAILEEEWSALESLEEA